MKTTKKVLMIVSLVSLSLACAMLIAGIFAPKFIFSGIPLHALLILGTMALGSGLSINVLNVIKQKKVLGYISLGFLGLSVLFALIVFFTPLLEKANTFNQITEIISFFSVLFLIIISLYAKLGKRVLPLQIVSYVCLCAVDIFLSLLVVGVDVLSTKPLLYIFLILIIVSIFSLIALLVISTKKTENEKNFAGIETITIAKVDYEKLLAENTELKKQIEELKK